MPQPERQPDREREIEIVLTPTIVGEEARLLHLMADKFGNGVSWSRGPNGIEVCDAQGKIVSRGKDFYEVLGIKRPEAEVLENDFIISVYRELIKKVKAAQLPYVKILVALDGRGANLDPLKEQMCDAASREIDRILLLINGFLQVYDGKIEVVLSPEFSDIVPVTGDALRLDQADALIALESLNSALKLILSGLSSVGFELPEGLEIQDKVNE